MKSSASNPPHFAQQLTISLTVENKMGLHARPAAMVVRLASRYPRTEVWVRRTNEQVNAKSIMGLLMLAAAKGTTLEFTAIGPDAEIVLKEMEHLFKRHFEEV